MSNVGFRALKVQRTIYGFYNYAIQRGNRDHTDLQQKKKLDPRSEECKFVGYDSDSPAYLVYLPNTNEIKKVRCVQFKKYEYKQIPEVTIYPQYEESVDNNSDNIASESPVQSSNDMTNKSN